MYSTDLAVKARLPVPNRLKIFGERNTGTNFIEKIATNNLATPVVPSNLPVLIRSGLSKMLWPLPYALRQRIVEKVRDRYFSVCHNKYITWKHAVAVNETGDASHLPTDVAYICLVKHPLSFLLSLQKRPYGAQTEPDRLRQLSLCEFARTPWHPLGRENKIGTYSSVLNMWNEKVASYFRLLGLRNAVIMRYEDVISDPVGELTVMVKELGVPKPNRGWRIAEESTKKDALKFSDYVEYYTNELWREKIDDQTFEFAEEALDKALLQRLRYRLT